MIKELGSPEKIAKMIRDSVQEIRQAVSIQKKDIDRKLTKITSR